MTFEEKRNLFIQRVELIEAEYPELFNQDKKNRFNDKFIDRLQTHYAINWTTGMMSFSKVLPIEIQDRLLAAAKSSFDDI